MTRQEDVTVRNTLKSSLFVGAAALLVTVGGCTDDGANNGTNPTLDAAFVGY